MSRFQRDYPFRQVGFSFSSDDASVVGVHPVGVFLNAGTVFVAGSLAITEAFAGAGAEIRVVTTSGLTLNAAFGVAVLTLNETLLLIDSQIIPATDELAIEILVAPITDGRCIVNLNVYQTEPSD